MRCYRCSRRPGLPATFRRVPPEGRRKFDRWVCRTGFGCAFVDDPEKRYRVVLVWGYLSVTIHAARPGVSAQVIDGVTGKLVAVFRSEEMGAWRKDTRALAIRKARDLAAELNAEEEALWVAL